MVLGFNHNVMYKGAVFHVQTEDSGVANPHIITLLYRGGVILGSKKTSYADIIKIENLEQLVEELMKEQHKEMMKRLKAGEFDDRAFPDHPVTGATLPVTPQPATIPEPAVETNNADLFSMSPLPPRTSSPQQDVSLLFEMPANKELPKKQEKPVTTPVSKPVLSLDEAILGFFGANDK